MEIKISKTIKELVKEYPNDYDLGSKVRDLVLRMEKIEKESEEKAEKDEK
jgi:hypothetical protein